MEEKIGSELPAGASWARRKQVERINQYWRIPAILPGGPNKANWVPTSPIFTPLMVVAVLGFLWFFIQLIRLSQSHGDALATDAAIHRDLLNAISFLALGFVSKVLLERIRRKNWARVSAKILDQEMRYTLGTTGLWAWRLRLLCEFVLNGQTYRVTPDLFPPSESGRRTIPLLQRNQLRGMEAPADSVVAYVKTITEPGGELTLLVNPDDPLEAERLKTGWDRIFQP
jgi:hypothetical protein